MEVACTSWQLAKSDRTAEGTYWGKVAAARAAVLQAPGCQLPDDGQAGARMAAPELVPLCRRRHEPHQQGQRWVQQRILAMKTASHVTLQEHMSGGKHSTAYTHVHTPQELPRH